MALDIVVFGAVIVFFVTCFYLLANEEIEGLWCLLGRNVVRNANLMMCLMQFCDTVCTLQYCTTVCVWNS